MDQRSWACHRRTWIWPAVSVIAISALAWLWWAGEHTKSISFSDQDWVLITQFDNRTGEDVLDGTLEYALERELNNSRFVKVIARNRVDDVLQLMQLPADTSVDTVQEFTFLVDFAGLEK
ncbi:hypothetical protein ACFL1V_00795 [Pseudomonadota bacterium]